MRNPLKSELWKATHNKFFYISLGIGVLLSFCDVVQNWMEVNYLTNLTIENLENGLGRGGHGGFSLFVMWIAVNGITFGSRAFYFVLPILAALPYGWSLSSEIKSGAIYQYGTRSSKMKYFLSKYTACFISGGLAVGVPVLMNLMVNALICPYEVPAVVSSISPIQNAWFLSEMYYTVPWIHAIIWCCMDFIWGGVAACLCFIPKKMGRFSFIVVIFPFALFYLWDIVYSSISAQLGYCISLSPMELTQAATLNPNPGWAVWLVICVLGFSGYLAGYWRVVRNEIL